ncbi:MAG: hypothetical protein ACRDKS_17510 [Actinomycetota bacterium]
MRRRGSARSAVALILLVLCLQGVAGATSQSNAVRVDARAGFGGVARRNVALPLIVVIESDSFFAGTVEILLPGATSIQRPIELPGNSRKELTFVVPRPNISEVRVLDRAKRVVARRQPSINQISNEDLIGVLSSAPPSVTHVTVRPIDRDSSVVAVTTAIVELGEGALDALSHLVVEAKAAAALSPRQRETVLAFAASGGELIVAASSEAELAFLPEAWRGSGRGDVRRIEVAGGHVTVALHPLTDAVWSDGGAMWSRTVRPADLGRWAGETDTPSQDWLEAITQSGGFGTPALGWLLVFVIAYVALVGPLNFIILGRLGKRELAWVTVPVLALVFAAGAYVAGRGTRDVPILHGSGIVVASDTYKRETFALAVLSRGGGDEVVRLPGTWLTDPLPFGDGSGTNWPVVRFARDTSEVTFPLAVGAVGTVAARRTSLTPGPGTGVLKATAGQFTGNVRNPFGVRLRNAGVFVGTAFESLGVLEAGAETTASVSDSSAPGQFEPVEITIEQNFFRFGTPENIGAIYPLVRRAGSTVGLGDPGRAFLVGFADLADVSGSTGLGRVEGSVMLIAPVRLDLAEVTELSSIGIRRDVVATDGFFEPSSTIDQIFEAREMVLRFELPAGRAAKTLVLHTQIDERFARGGIIVKPLPPGVGPGAPDVLGANGVELSLYDFAKQRWHQVTTGDGRVVLSSSEAARFLSPAGEFFVRLSSEFPQAYSAGSLALSGELA